MNTNKWDNLAEYFSSSNTSSADNVELAEPIIIEELKKLKHLRIIDFGCGSGKFCKRVSVICEKLLGIDTSTKMIKMAKEKNSAPNIQYTSRPIYELDISGFNVLNAEFVIQFLPDEELEELLAYLAKNKINKIIISNHRLEFIENCIRQKKGNYSCEKGEYRITVRGNTIRFYPRKLKTLAEMFRRHGFKLTMAQDIRFPEAFLEKYPDWKKKPMNMAVHNVLFFERN